MKKKLVLFCLMLTSILGLFACKADPYSSMTITKLDEGGVIQLNIEETVNSSGTTIYAYDSVSFDIQVSDRDKDTNLGIIASDGKGFIETSLEYKGYGITTVTVKPISPNNTGKFTLNFKTIEGNKSLNVDFNIDLKLNNFEFKQDNLKVVAKGGELDLSNLDKYISFEPFATTQKDIKFEVAVPFGNTIVDKIDEIVYDYPYVSEIDEDYHKYAEIIDNKILKTYSTYVDIDGNIQKVIYPTTDIETNIAGDQIAKKCITLKATATYADATGQNKVIVKFIDLEVIDECTDINLQINNQKNEYDGSEFVTIERNKLGEYDIVLLDPNYREGALYPTYYIERDLEFNLGSLLEDLDYNPNDYKVVTNFILETDNLPIVLSPNSNINSFKVQAQKAGNYSHVFTVQNIDYPGVFDKEVVVNFKVMDIPTSIKINNTAIADNYTVYDFYSKTYGARFNVDLNTTYGNFDYFVFVENFEQIEDVHMYKNDGTEQVFAKWTDTDGEGVLSSVKEGENYSLFKNQESFYLRHSLSSLPSDNVQIFVGIKFSMAASSYSEETKNGYFLDTILSFPLNINFENGLREISFAQNKYYVNLTNPNNLINSEDNGVKLFDLPIGQTYEKSILSITYDQDLISVISKYDEDINVTSLYIKANEEYKVGETTITIKAKNGLENSVFVQTYIPTSYANFTDNTSVYYMPLGIELNRDSSGYLYSMSGKENHNALWTLYKNVDTETIGWGNYNSISSLFMLLNGEQEIKFFDYLLYSDASEQKVKKLDITDQVVISFNYSNYVTYKNGKLYSKRITMDKSNPVVMTISYNAGYEDVDADNNVIYSNITITHQVNIYVYKALDGVQVDTAKVVDLYINNSLGYYDKDLSTHKIISNFAPNEVELGSEWNDGVWNPVDLYPDESLLNNKILRADGTEIVIESNNGVYKRNIYYKDLFTISAGSDYSFTITCELTNIPSNGELGLLDWIEQNGGNVDLFLNNLFSNNISFTFNIYVKQFDKLQNINSIRINGKFANKINDLKLDIEDDGLYFEVRKGENNQLIANIDKYEVNYTINSADVVNKNVRLINYNTGSYSSYVEASLIGTYGTIYVIPKLYPGENYLTVVPEDNIKVGLESGETIQYYNVDLVKTFRIKVANGSKDYPFEIRTVNDYLQMLEDIKAGRYYHYIITRDINLANLNLEQVDIGNKDKGQFELNGRHVYSRNGQTITRFSTIYNLTITKTIDTATTDINIGLFGKLGSAVTIRDIVISNANIRINTKETASQNKVSTFNIGIIAGQSEYSTILNSKVSGNIKIVGTNDTYKSYVLNIGGMIGSAESTTITGMPSSYVQGVSSTGDNVYVDIDLTKFNPTTTNDNNISVGGVVGELINNSKLEELQIVSNIKAVTYGNYGGVIGLSDNVTINKLQVSPKLTINTNLNDNTKQLNIGGVIGVNGISNDKNSLLTNTKIMFVNIGTDYSAIEKANIYVNAPNMEDINVGGFVGNDKQGFKQFAYSYARSFYNSDISTTYKGNILVNAKAGNVGGIVGLELNKINMEKSYFDGDIVASINANKGLLFGKVDSSNIDDAGVRIENSYAIGFVYGIDSENQLVEVTDFSSNSGIIGGLSMSSDELKLNAFLKISGYGETDSVFEFDNTYAVVNKNKYYIAEGDNIFGKSEDGQTIEEIMFNLDVVYLFGLFGYSITYGEDEDVGNYDWFYNNEINMVDYNGKIVSYPLIIHNGKVLYDLVPTGISVIINDDKTNNLFDLTYNGTTQVLMFLNKNESGYSGEFYEIGYNKDTCAVEIKLNGKTISTTHITIPLNDSVEITEDSFGGIIEIVGNKIYARNEGVATITINSYLDKTVKTEFKIKVVNGITSVDFYEYDESSPIIRDSKDPINIYIDEISNFRLINSNNVTDVHGNIENKYYALNNTGYIVEILDSGLVNAKININSKDYTYIAGESNVYKFDSVESFVFKGVTLGSLNVKITPFIHLNDLIFKDTYTTANFKFITYDNIYLLDSSDTLYKTYTFKSIARAQSIQNSIHNATLSPKNTFNFKTVVETANVLVDATNKFTLLENLYLAIGEKIFELQVMNNEYSCTEVGSNSGIFTTNIHSEFKYELIIIKISNITFEKTNVNAEIRQNTYKVSFDISISFDRDYYRLNANDFDLNTIAYLLKIVPTSNTVIFDSLNIKINPITLTEIFTNFYSRGENRLGEDNTENDYPVENESNFIVPGRKGLLKITLDQEFNNSSYITITLNKKYQGYVTLKQKAGKVDTPVGDSDLTIGDIIQYEDVSFNEEFESNTEYGIRLSKMSINYLDNHYFNNTYYVEVYLERDYSGFENIDLKITSYKIENQQIITQLFVTKALNITYLPVINATIDDKTDAVIGKGVQKELQITHKGIEENIYYSLKDISGNNTNNGLVYIIDSDGNKVGGIQGELSISYLNNGGKYYLCVDVTASLNDIQIKFSAEEYILGVRETAEYLLNINIVEFEIETVEINGIVSETNTLRLLHGESIILQTNIIYKNITVGTKTDIENYIKTLNHYFGMNDSSELGVKEKIEYNFAGTQVTQTDVLTEDTLRLFELNYKNGEKVDKQLGIGDYSYFSIKEYSEDYEIGGKQTLFKYYIIKGTSISNNTTLRLKMPYYYQNGKIVVGDLVDVYEEVVVEFILNVVDNSTADHPNPIENQEDLINAAQSDGGDYILVNDIILNNWSPVNATFNSLDGNGYSIIINSFDFRNIRSTEEINAGIFASTSEETLLKNIIVDVKNILISEIDMLNNLQIQKNSTETTYRYNSKIDLSYVENVTFGLLVGQNNGAITNAKIVNSAKVELNGNEDEKQSTTALYLHVATTQGYIEEQIAIANIGGLVGHNTKTGAITNSFVGLDLSTATNDSSAKLNKVFGSSALTYNNESDNMSEVSIYPFSIAGGKNIGGLVSKNEGTISNSYVKGIGVYNTFPTINDTMTGGLVAVNDNTITSCFIEGTVVNNYRANDDYFKIESTGNVGGLVYQNNNLIENSYSNINLETQSAFTGGFVFVNNGTIQNSYSTAINKNSLAHGQFTGVQRRIVQNFGEYINCYYLVLDNELANEKEHATAIVASSYNNDIGNTSIWHGYSFATTENADGIWYMPKDERKTPQITSSRISTNSFRRLKDKEIQESNENNLQSTVYNYDYDHNYKLGSQKNPLIIDKAKHFDSYILSRADVDTNGKRVFGVAANNNSILSDVVDYVRIVNNLDFTNLTTATKYYDTGDTVGAYLYESVFAGNLDGNGLSLLNLNINTDTVQLTNFGLFAQVGVETSVSTKQTVIKNLNITLRSYKSSDSSRAGILAGTIVNSSIINVKINANDIMIGGRNMAGSLAGLIYADAEGSVSIIDVTVENVAVEATYGSLGGEITAFSEDTSNYFFNEFSIQNNETQTKVNKSFVSLYDIESNTTFIDKDNAGNDIKTQVSYAGAVAGVVLANNYSTEIVESNRYDTYRTKSDSNSIDNIIVKNNLTISTADNAGGLFGYVGEKTHIKNSKLLLNDNQLIKAFNFAGGLVGENHGILELCYVAHSEETQKTIDANMLNDNRTISSYNLFDMQGSSYYTVSIGGIAGYSNNGVIIDSYAKVNVIKPLSYIAGGIIGYAEGYNYLGFVYNTGVVFGKFITGGAIGLQVNDYGVVDDAQNAEKIIKNRVVMDRVVSLANWNDSTQTTNYRDEITKRLYNNYKVMYEKDGFGYLDFYIKLPEIGNADINLYDIEKISEIDDSTGETITTLKTSTQTNYTDYANNHDQYFVGSVVGKSLLRDGDYDSTSIYNGYEGPDKDESMLKTTSIYVDKTIEIINSTGGIEYSETTEGQALINNLYSSSKAVFSTTFGLYSTTGSLENANRQDTYNSNTFSLDVGLENTVNMRSYRVAYNESDGLNKYEYIDILDDSAEHKDIFDFNKVFTSQEYIQQLLGGYYIINNDEKNNKITQNVFKVNYNLDRFEVGSNPDDTTFIENINSVWLMDGYLPKFANTLYAGVEIIGGDEVDDSVYVNKLKTALSSNASGKIYYITRDLTLNITNNQKTIEYANSIKSIFIGKKGNGDDRITLTINVNESSSVATIFNLLSGAVFNNINFVINYNNNDDYDLDKISPTKLSMARKDYNNYGLLANSLENVSINNCSFKLNINGDNLAITHDVNAGEQSYFNSQNVGLLFGNINNSTITNSSFEIVMREITLLNDEKSIEPRIVLSNEKISNFGLFVGNITNSNIKSNKFNIDKIVDVNINNVSLDANIGGIFGKLTSSNYSDIQLCPKGINITDNVDKSKNISSMIGSSVNSTISGISDTMDKLKLDYNNTKSMSGVINLSTVIAKSYNLSIKSFNLSNIEGISVTSTIDINTINIGSLIAYDEGNSIIGNSSSLNKIEDWGLVKIEDYVNIKVNVLSDNLSVGGLIGYSKNNLTINNSYNNSYINATNNKIGYQVTQTVNGKDQNVTYTAKTSIGGLVGNSNGKIVISDVYNAGLIKTALKSEYVPNANNPIQVAIGGLVGYSASSCDISNFAVLNNFEMSNNFDYLNVYLSGIIGLNKSLVTVRNGYTYAELPKMSKVITSNITNNTISSSSANVYYAQEFVGNNYMSDSKFTSFAMGDLYDSLSEYSNLYSIMSTNQFVLESVGNTKLPIPRGVANTISIVAGSRGEDKFNLRPVTAVGDIADISDYKYNVISDNIEITAAVDSKLAEEGSSSIISGRSTDMGKVVLKINVPTGASETTYIINKNNGVLSNIYLNCDSKNVALVGENNGLITNCFVYERTTAYYPIANINNGNIYQCASSVVVSISESNNKIYGLVCENYGMISDCYSSSFGYSANSKYHTNIYGFASINDGTIQYSYYYIPDVMKYDNTAKAYYDIEEDKDSEGKINNCENNKQLPSFAKSRTGIWVSDNSMEHSQIKGFKDIDGSIVIYVKYNGMHISVKGNESGTKTIENIKNDISNISGVSSASYSFTYEVGFYVKQNEIPLYNVIRIDSGSTFESYISSLEYGIIPQNTIVIIANDIKVNAKNISSFSISSNAMILGIAYDQDGNKVTPIIDFNNSVIDSELINVNEGMIVDIEFKNLELRYMSSSGGVFAPIVYNIGVLAKITFKNCIIKGLNSTQVSGLCYSSNGVIRDCQLKDYNITSQKWLALLCYKNAGKVSENYVGSGSFTGSLNTSGVN